MKPPTLTKPLNGLKEEIIIEIAENRIIQNPVIRHTTLEKLYDDFNASTKIHSYAGHTAACRIGFAELHGRREYQEDRIVFGFVPDFKVLSKSQKLSVLNQTIMKLTAIIASHEMPRTGSTLCLIVTDENYIYTVNVGDSTAYLAVLNADDESIQFKRLNQHLHQPTEPLERMRLEEAGKQGFIHYKRLMGLALSRSMGDTDLEPFGLIHTPDIYTDEIIMPEKGKAFALIACDGLTEGNCLAEHKEIGIESIEQLMEANAKNSLEDIASILTHEAFDKGSTDNISVLITNIENRMTPPKYMAVFDGHGGVACADLLRKNFHTVFVDEINHALKEENIQ